MRYLRQQNINRRAPYDQRLYVDMTDSIVMTTTNNMLMPVGTTAQRPVSPINGMIRYNTSLGTNGEVEVFQAGSWRSLSFKEATAIKQQNLGTGDDVEIVFGPLSPAPAAGAPQAGITWDVAQFAKQIIVVVENVIQLAGTNYDVLQNPARATGTILSFSSIGNTITSSNTGVGGINFSTLKFQPGQQITVSGSTFNNGVYTIDTVSASQLTVLSALTDESAGSTISIVGPYSTGYFVVFGSAVPGTKVVTALHGFDQ